MTDNPNGDLDSRGIDIRVAVPDDDAALATFFARIPEEDRLFFREDVLDPTVRASWYHEGRIHRLVAFDPSGTIVGSLAIVPEVGWSSHVGELRVVIDPRHRGIGLGRALARRGLLESLEMGLSKIVVHALADQQSTIELFSKIGFEGEALLRNHVQDRSGEFRDLILLAHTVAEEWSALATAGITDEFA